MKLCMCWMLLKLLRFRRARGWCYLLHLVCLCLCLSSLSNLHDLLCNLYSLRMHLLLCLCLLHGLDSLSTLGAALRSEVSVESV